MNKTKTFLLTVFILMTVLFTYCEKEKFQQTTDKNYLTVINKWHQKRIANLKKENGWLNLVGLFWLKEGENSFGSDKSNDIIFPDGKSEKYIGKIIKKDSIITTIINEEIKVLYNGNRINNIEMKADVSGDPTILSHRSLKWFIIKRDDKYGIRLRDLEAELLTDFEGIERFVAQDKWKINATFKKYDPPKKIMIPTILGTVNESISPGKLLFKIDNIEYSLEPTGSVRGYLLFLLT